MNADVDGKVTGTDCKSVASGQPGSSPGGGNPSPVPAMTPDEARATLCRSVAAQLEESVKRAEADLDARQAAPGFEPTPETNNIALVTLATLELRDMLLVSAKQFDKADRPRILRPERAVRIVR
jgi:hypothetical protein